jgi:hypothetical protein
VKNVGMSLALGLGPSLSEDMGVSPVVLGAPIYRIQYKEERETMSVGKLF